MGISNQVTILTTNQNRPSELAQSLANWQLLEDVAEIVVVDWSSEPAIQLEVSRDGWTNGAIPRVVRVDGEDRWSASRALNFGLRFVQTPIVLKLDAEITVRPDFLQLHPLERGEFWSGNWKNALPWNKSIHGSCLGWVDDFEAIGGWDPRIEGYGWEDTDFYLRLESNGLFRRDFRPGSLSHRNQSDTSRVNTRGRQGSLSPEQSVVANRFVALEDNPWSKAMATNREDLDRKNLIHRKNLVVESVARVTARRNANAGFGQLITQLYWALRYRIRSWLQHSGLKVHNPFIYVEANFGLGNRLRVVYSALLIAKATRRKLVVVWIPDEHCGVRLTELFDYRGLVIDRVEYLSPILQRKRLRVINYTETGFHPQKGERISRLPRNKDVYISAFSALRHRTVSTREMGWLARTWTPVDEITRQINQHFPSDYGVHCRSEVPNRHSASFDQSAGNWSDSGHLKLIENRLATGPEVFVESLLSAIKGQRSIPKLALHVASDSKTSKQTIVESVKDYFEIVRTIPSVALRSEHAVKQALVEAYVLANSDFFIGSRYSAFSELVLLLRNPRKGHEMLPG